MSAEMAQVTSYTWDDAGRLTGVTWPNATKRTLKWDAAEQLLGIEESPGSGAPLVLRSFQYDAVGRLTKRLSYPQGAAWSEPAWNAVYNDDNRLINLAGVALNYDTDGNLLGSRLPNGPWGASGTSTNANGTFTWNARNELTQVVRSNNAQQINYTYDAEGHLIQSTDSVGGITRWIIDPNGGDCSRILSKVAPNGEVTRYVYGVGLVYEVRQNGGVRYYHYDQIGNTIALTDHNGAVTGAADYTPYGNLQSASGELANANVTPFLFVGAYGVMTDTATGLHQMRARWYSSHLRRFLSEDPAGFAGGENFYAYSGNNPLSMIDPWGLCEMSANKLTNAWTNTSGAKFAHAFLHGDNNGMLKYGTQSFVQTLGQGAANMLALEGAAILKPIASFVGKVSAPVFNSVGRFFSASRAARTTVDEGTQLFRVFGNEAKGLGQYYTTVNPNTVSNFREAAGLFPGNSGRFVLQGTLKNTEGVIFRPAAPGPGGIGGGLPETFVPNPQLQIKILRVSGANPNF